jgi:hypothetical protein
LSSYRLTDAECSPEFQDITVNWENGLTLL